MRLPVPTLRRKITVVVVTLALLATLAAAALVALTSVQHHARIRSAAAVESVRLAEEAQRDLLLHDRVVDPAVRAQIAAGLHGRLFASRAQLGSTEQAQALAVAERAVEDYLAAHDSSAASRAEIAAAHSAAFASLESLVALDLDQVHRAYASAGRYDELASTIGIAVGAGVSLAAVFVLWWLHRRALRPLAGLASTMRRFGRGDVDERASEDGPAELAEMARRFNEMASSIARQRRERHTFIASVVHDLRNPLSVLRMANDLARGANGHALGPERAAHVRDMVGRQIDRLERMTDDLLDSVSVEAGKLRLHVAKHDVCGIATDVAQHYQSSSPKHAIIVDVPPSGILLECDAMRVEQILSNLVSNAIKYSPKGGRVSVALKECEETVLLQVSDAGVGMNDEDAVTAFEPFRRSALVSDLVAGSGLGLFVVRRLVEAHGGRIDLHTTLGSGSTFDVWLPTAPRHDVAAPTAGI